MKEIYFKSFGYKTKDKKKAFACIGLALEYDENLKIINSLTSVNFYKNIPNSEEANVIAGFDILTAVEKNHFVKGNETLGVCLTTNSLINHFEKFYGNKGLDQLLTKRQDGINNLFSQKILQSKKFLKIKMPVFLGLSNSRNLIGIDFLSMIEDEVISQIQYVVDKENEYLINKSNVLASEISLLKTQQKIEVEGIRRIQEHKDAAKVNCYDNEQTRNLVNLFKSKSAFVNSENIIKEINNDMSLVPKHHMYF